MFGEAATIGGNSLSVWRPLEGPYKGIFSLGEELRVGHGPRRLAEAGCYLSRSVGWKALASNSGSWRRRFFYSVKTRGGRSQWRQSAVLEGAEMPSCEALWIAFA